MQCAIFSKSHKKRPKVLRSTEEEAPRRRCSLKIHPLRYSLAAALGAHAYLYIMKEILPKTIIGTYFGSSKYNNNNSERIQTNGILKNILTTDCFMCYTLFHKSKGPSARSRSHKNNSTYTMEFYYEATRRNLF